MRRLVNAAAMLLVPFVLTACAASAGTSGTDAPAAAVDADRVQLRVQNNHPDGSVATIFVVPAVGVRRQLGDVDFGNTRDFVYQFPNRGNYRMEAVYPGGTTRRTDEFRIAGGETVVWETRGSRVIVSRAP